MLEIIGLACVGVLWINAEPTIRLREWLYKKIYKCSRFDHKWHWRLINCAMCSTFHIYFWYQLFFEFRVDIIGASVCAVIAEIISRHLNSGSL